MNVASLDIGTNTALLLIANINNSEINSKNKYIPAAALKTVLNEYRMPRLGKGLTPGGEISRQSIESLHLALADYMKLVREHGCTKVVAAGTNALRIASNSASVISEVKHRFGIDIEVISGEKEAALTFLGAASSARSDIIMLIDIGGGSTEITLGKGGHILFSHSLQLGAVTLSEKYVHGGNGGWEKMHGEILEILKPIEEMIFGSKELAEIAAAAEPVAVAGTPVSLASIKMQLMSYQEEMVEGYELKQEDIKSIIERLKVQSPEEILKNYGEVLRGREDIIAAGSMILSSILSLFCKPAVTVSTRGLRYGLVLSS